MMESNWTILLVIIVTLAMTIQSGCQEAEKATKTETKIVVQDTKSQTKEPIETQDKASQIPEEKTPVLKVEKPVHDFGKVAPNKKYNCQFEFKNVGDAQLKIAKIQSTCGCTVPQLKKKIYAPGESGTVHVAFRTPTRAGKTSKRLYILSNDKKSLLILNKRNDQDYF